MVIELSLLSSSYPIASLSHRLVRKIFLTFDLSTFDPPLLYCARQRPVNERGSRVERGMLATVLSCATVGLDGLLVQVEVDVGSGQPGLAVVGLPDAAIQEAKERVRAAIRNAGARMPDGCPYPRCG